MKRRHLAALVGATLIGLISAACGDAASVSVAPTATSTPLAATTVVTPTPAATTGLAWTISDTSKATVRVREQLASFNFPSDAVLVATGAKGGFQINDNGTFSSDSKVTFNVDSLRSDASQRDGFVKMTVLNTRQFPTATFVPTKVTGVTLPLAVSGTFTFTLSGKLTIHGVDKDVTFDVQASRAGSGLTATATLNPTIKFGDFGMPLPAAPGRVLSVVDEIKLVIDLVATGPNG